MADTESSFPLGYHSHTAPVHGYPLLVSVAGIPTVVYGVSMDDPELAVYRLQAMANTISAHSNRQETGRITPATRCRGCAFVDMVDRTDAPTIAAKQERCRAVLGLPSCELARTTHVQDSGSRDCQARYLVWQRLHGQEAAEAASSLAAAS